MPKKKTNLNKPATRSRSSKRKILVVEHDPKRQQFFADMIGALGDESIITSDARDALGAMHELPDAIFLNLFMPHMSSLSFLGFKESHPMYREIPLFIVSDHDEQTLQNAFGESVAGTFDTQEYSERALTDALRDFFDQL